jgi:hypothetical protein
MFMLDEAAVCAESGLQRIRNDEPGKIVFVLFSLNIGQLHQAF